MVKSENSVLENAEDGSLFEIVYDASFIGKLLLIILFLPALLMADSFYTMVTYSCETQKDQMLISYKAAYNKAGKAMLENRPKDAWTPWELMLTEKGYVTDLKSKSVQRTCQLSDGNYTAYISAVPGNRNLMGRGGGSADAYVKITKEGMLLGGTVLGLSFDQQSGVIQARVTTNPSTIHYTHITNKDYYTQSVQKSGTTWESTVSLASAKAVSKEETIAPPMLPFPEAEQKAMAAMEDMAEYYEIGSCDKSFGASGCEKMKDDIFKECNVSWVKPLYETDDYDDPKLKKILGACHNLKLNYRAHAKQKLNAWGKEMNPYAYKSHGDFRVWALPFDSNPGKELIFSSGRYSKWGEQHFYLLHTEKCAESWEKAQPAMREGKDEEAEWWYQRSFIGKIKTIGSRFELDGKTLTGSLNGILWYQGKYYIYEILNLGYPGYFHGLTVVGESLDSNIRYSRILSWKIKQKIYKKLKEQLKKGK